MSPLDFVRNLLGRKFDVKSESINPGVALADLGLDSLSVVEIAFEVSDHYGVDMSDERTTFNTLGEFVVAVDALVQAKTA